MASLLDGASLDLVALFEDASASSEVDVSGRQVVQALVIAAVIVVVYEAGNGALEVAGQMVVFKEDAALQREVPAIDLALGHRVVGLAARMAPAVCFKPIGRFADRVRA